MAKKDIDIMIIDTKKEYSEAVNTAKEITSSLEPTNLIDINIDTIRQYYLSYQSYLDQLTLEQKGAIINISLAVTIFFCLTTLLGVFAGDRIVEYFKLETRYPKLAKFFTLRRKFR